jgi:ubiquinone/menaquinone biosynthesis C-methylase UbiE
MGKGDNKKAEEARTRAWLAERAEGFLRRVGLVEGKTVPDFGCNRGNYARPAARVVGPGGRVCAVGKDKKALRELRRTVRRKGLRNVEHLHVSEGGRIPLRAGSMDIALLYDVLHRGYHPEASQRKHILREIHRVLKPGGLLSLFPTHLKKYGLTFDELTREVRRSGFRPRRESRRRLVHDGKLVRGRVLSFRRERGARRA